MKLTFDYVGNQRSYVTMTLHGDTPIWKFRIRNRGETKIIIIDILYSGYIVYIFLFIY